MSIVRGDANATHADKDYGAVRELNHDHNYCAQVLTNHQILREFKFCNFIKGKNITLCPAKDFTVKPPGKKWLSKFIIS